MVTFHASVSKCRDGWRPMVIVRNPKGQCVGSRVAHGVVFTSKAFARDYARARAHHVASRLEFVRVS